MSGECTDLRIGATALGLLPLRYREIPEPDQWSFTPYSVVRICGTGRAKGYGFPTASWTWETLDQYALSKLLAFFACDTDAGVELYISTYTDTDRKRQVADYSAMMQRPVDGDGKSMYPRVGGNIFQNVTVQFTHLESA